MKDELPMANEPMPKFRAIDSSITVQRDGKTFDLFIGVMAQSKSQAQLAYLVGTLHGALLQMGHMPQFRLMPDQTKDGGV